MIQEKPRPAGYLTFTLHAHLPYVVNHGTWPHGIEWLHEAAAETYLPLLRVLGNLQRDGIKLCCNLNLSPILLEQLAHPVFKEEFPRYVERKITSSREDEAFFQSIGDHHLATTARQWNAFFSETLSHFQSLNRDIIQGFRFFHAEGMIEIITSAATHGYMPLLGTDESVRAQIRTAINAHIRHIGEAPRGMWAPECGYRPAGLWHYPVDNADGSPAAPAYNRIGVEQALAESNIDYFFVDTHLVEESAHVRSPYDKPRSSIPGTKRAPSTGAEDRDLYHPHFVGTSINIHPTTVFARDPRTGMQVWSGDSGYPGDPNYLDFHKKRWPGGHRYWKVTGSGVDMGDKEYYYPDKATERVRAHAQHFVSLVQEALEAEPATGRPPILCSPFDAELFGHWWFEGPQWLEAVAREIHAHPAGPQLITCSSYLKKYPANNVIAMHEGSWGAEGTNHVWLNPETSWTYQHIYPAEITTRNICTAGTWSETSEGQRIVKQLCRELLLLESSDWQFLITTGAARDYAELRFTTHNEHVNQLIGLWNTFEANGTLTPDEDAALSAIELRDNIFPDIDPSFWATGSHATPSQATAAPKEQGQLS